MTPKILDLKETVEGMHKMLRRLIGEDIEIAWLPISTFWPVMMDPSQIDQGLANLCVNASDAIESVGKISIETRNATIDEIYGVYRRPRPVCSLATAAAIFKNPN